MQSSLLDFSSTRQKHPRLHGFSFSFQLSVSLSPRFAFSQTLSLPQFLRFRRHVPVFLIHVVPKAHGPHRPHPVRFRPGLPPNHGRRFHHRTQSRILGPSIAVLLYGPPPVLLRRLVFHHLRVNLQGQFLRRSQTTTTTAAAPATQRVTEIVRPEWDGRWGFRNG